MHYGLFRVLSVGLSWHHCLKFADEEMKRHLHILGVSKSKYRTSTGELMLYSGRDDDQHHEGAAIILKKRAAIILKKGVEKYLPEYKPINSKLMQIRPRGRHVNTTIIQCYTPTNNSDKERKETFYDQVQAELENMPQHLSLVGEVKVHLCIL